MNSNNKDILLLLRAFGDFVIAINTARGSRRKQEIKIVASRHLQPLYHALPAEYHLTDVDIEFRDFGIRKNLLRVFSNRHLLNRQTLKELFAVRSFVKTQATGNVFFAEQKKRISVLSFFTGRRFGYVVDAENVYKGYSEFFNAPQSLQDFPTEGEIKKVVVIPDARIEARKIPSSIIEKIKTQYATAVTCIAFFKSVPRDETNAVSYRNFEELVALLADADVVIVPDSMPAHLCQLLHKPHYIIYPSGVEDQFFTPFALQHNRCFRFDTIHSRPTFLPQS